MGYVPKGEPCRRRRPNNGGTRVESSSTPISRRVPAASFWTGSRTRGRLVIKSLGDGPRRYSEVSHQLVGVSQKMLTQTLRSLERDGLVTRTVTPSVPVRVDYELTPLGRSLAGILGELKAWAEQHMPAVEQARAEYDASRERALA